MLLLVLLSKGLSSYGINLSRISDGKESFPLALTWFPFSLNSKQKHVESTVYLAQILIVQKLLADAGEDKDLSRVESAGVADDKDNGAVNHLPRWRIVMMVSAAAFFLVLTTIIVWLTIVTEQ